jgi:hypothetical protein
MDRIIKVFCGRAEQAALAKAHKAIEHYAAFVLLQVAARAAKTLARQYPVEDITALYTIETGERSIDTARPRVDSAGKTCAHPAYKDVKRLAPGKHHYLVQFIGPIKSAWLAAVKQAGGEPRAPYENFAYVVRANEKQRARIAALPSVRWVGHLPHRARLAPGLALPLKGRARAALPRTRKRRGVFTVEFFGPEDMRAGVAATRKLGFKVLASDAKARIAIVESAEASGRRLERLSAVHGVRAIRERAFKRTSNDVAAGIMGTARSLATNSLGLSGKGETIAVCDTGIDTGDAGDIHPDFTGRVGWIKSYPITPDFSSYIRNPGGNDGAADLDSGHGTHVTGSVLGSGAASRGLAGTSGLIRGPAYAARLVFQAIEQELQWKDPADAQLYGRYLLAGIPADLSTLFADAYRKGARIHSNSWGGGDPGEYDEQSEQLDRYVWKHRTFCVVVAAGNDGTDADGDGKINPMSVTSPATAKNCVTVGACENRRTNFNSETYGKWWPQDYPAAPYRNDPMANNSDQVAAFSSRGPTRDGRTKPEVVAPGTFILSTRSTQIAANNKAWAAFPPSRLYFHMGGTSMATPLVAGALGVIREYLRRQKRMASPSAALLKATLILGARRLPGYAAADAVLDNQQGFGRVDVDAALAPSSPARTEFRDVKPGLRTGEARSYALRVKSNQVALRIVLAYSDYPGAALVNNLNLLVTDPNGARYVGNQGGASLTMDAHNNVEVVQVRRPVAGDWRIEVVGSNIPQGPQPFALVWQAHLG